ncbi:MAG: hypothetical protein BGO78_16330 [Chloroflexi bacterium 44-23]|nr:MAG: hypothetical protein BGO78_16330 [Chloroflexi bacterium 44-23]
MQTPYGKECHYFYGDYYRGRHHEECRLLDPLISSSQWTSKLCKNCPVPGILRANSCEKMVLKGEINQGILGIGKSMKISAYCIKSEKVVTDPYVGCGLCHPLSDIIFKDK